MALTMMQALVRNNCQRLNRALTSQLSVIPSAGFHTSQVLAIKTAGRHKLSIKKDKPLTYEQSFKPDMIGVRKAWNTINSTGFTDSVKTAEVTHEDIFIRKFMHGTWPRLLASDVIIRRRGNTVILNFMCNRNAPPTAIYFLIGYTEEILSYILKANFRIELQTINDSSEMIYKYI